MLRPRAESERLRDEYVSELRGAETQPRRC